VASGPAGDFFGFDAKGVGIAATLFETMERLP
jgi:hypothetical protein